jgi:membrane protein DedA with SNARE-associated domain
MASMQPVLEFVLRYGYWLLFLNVFSEQLAIPLPAAPVLLAMGALAGLGNFSFGFSLFLATSACVICDQVWYRLGRGKGNSILRLVCRVSLEPDSCVSNTKSMFVRWGAWSLIVSKFVPGLSAVAAPLSGLTRMPLVKFSSAALIGSILWTGSYLSLGYLFRTQLEEIAQKASGFAGGIATVVIFIVFGYAAYKFIQRQRFLRGLRVARLTPTELNQLMQSGEVPIVIELRDALEVEAGGVKLPGALWIRKDDMEAHKDDIPRDREVILYCS